MSGKIKKTLVLITVFGLALALVGAAGIAMATGSIYVNDGTGTISGSLGSAYAVGGDGSISMVGDIYAITGSGTVKVGGGGATGDVPSGDPDGSTVSAKQNTVRVGLYFAADALAQANLENKVGKGYKFGYYDSNRQFHELGSTNETKISMKPTGTGTEVSVYITNTDTVIYTHTDRNYNLAVRPVSTSGKSVTWFKNNTYYGDFEYYRYHTDRLTVIGVLNLEDYIKGVIPYEMSASWPLEALKAQAVCARTYFASNVNRYPQYKFDVTNTVASQVYFGTKSSNATTDAAVDQTAGQYVTYNGKMCSTMYASSFGGASEDNENVNGNNYHPYLKGVIDPYEAAANNINSNGIWSPAPVFTPKELGAKVGLGAIASLAPTYSDTNNCIKIVFTDVDGKTATVQRDACRTKLGLKSIHYTISRNAEGNFVFSGGGWGHNLGMSQFGAYAMAKHYGFNYRQILRFYYTGIKISTGV